MTFATLTQKIAFTASTIAVAGFVAAAPAQAATIGQWNFNDSNAIVDVGVGTASLVGGTTAAFATGNAAGDAGQAWNTATYPTQGNGNKTAGVRFLVPTTGFENIIVSFEQRFSNTAANLSAIQYTTDGTTYTGLPEQLLAATAGDTWFTFNSGALGAAANNNPNFGFQVLAAFNPTAYVASNPTSTYGTTGTRRFDLVTVSGDATTPVPTPALLPGLVGLGLGVLRKRKSEVA
jgi:hypothetical protein